MKFTTKEKAEVEKPIVVSVRGDDRGVRIYFDDVDILYCCGDEIVKVCTPKYRPARKELEAKGIKFDDKDEIIIR